MPILIILCLIGLPLTVIIGGLLFIVGLYNGLVRAKVLVDEAWSGIDVQLKRRYDLIPNLVETVKGYASHEKSTFEEVTKLRSMAMQATDVAEKSKLENQLTNTLKSLFAVAENYPELKANENFLNLQGTLNEIETEIQGARRYYNGAVRDFNTKIMVFPNNLIAGMLGFTAREFFEAEEGERENVKVDFKS
ncbi:MAG: LemA family protein [candidate division WS6 bacterium OLB20]|uniref:LemA family protein n=1 Tax=candidate division WS6 bacterium OLB20 TaxID=1617426 RepID=A0A136LW53_9BACT|nr:MAG: LemA family protein [candidate division WS6 bacterium OLB20]